MELLREADAQLEGAEAVVIGRSNLVGKPMAPAAGGERDRHDVPLAHARPRRGLPRADILVAAVGGPRWSRRDWVKAGRDRDRRRHEPHRRRPRGRRRLRGRRAEGASAITPVPGGVGPMTIAMLLRNTLRAAPVRRAGRLPLPSGILEPCDLSRLRTGEWVAGSAGFMLLISLFFWTGTPSLRMRRERQPWLVLLCHRRAPRDRGSSAGRHVVPPPSAPGDTGFGRVAHRSRGLRHLRARARQRVLSLPAGGGRRAQIGLISASSRRSRAHRRVASLGSVVPDERKAAPREHAAAAAERPLRTGLRRQ